MALREYGTSAIRGTTLWGLPMFVLAGAFFYFKTRALIADGAPPETMRNFWWPYVPLLLAWFLGIGAVFGVALRVITDLFSARRRTGS